MDEAAGVRRPSFEVYLLDTNVVSELRKTKPHGAVLAWLDNVSGAQLAVPAIVLGEIQLGIERLRLRDPQRADMIEIWADRLADSFEIMPMTGALFRRWARLVHGEPDHFRQDAMIAATAIDHGLTVVTRNVRDFERFHVAVLNPFEWTSEPV